MAKLADGLGSVFLLGDNLYQELPGQEPKRLLTVAAGTSVEYVEPHLRFVLLHERLRFLNVQQVNPLPTPGQLPGPSKTAGGEDPGSRLVYLALDTQERRTLIPHFYQYNLTLAMHPDGRTAAVRTQLEPGDSEAQNIYLLDVETAELEPLLLGRRVYLYSWSPDGKTLGLLGAPSVRAKTDLAVIDRETKAFRLLKTFEEGVGAFLWLGESGRILVSPADRKYANQVKVGLYGVDGSQEAYELALDEESHVALGLASPDGSQVLGLLYPITGKGERQLLLWPAERRLRLLPEGARWVSWAEQGATLLCGEDKEASPTPCGFFTP